MTLLHISIIISVAMLVLASILSLLRLFIGPSLPDRVVALDLLAILVICLIAVYSVYSGYQIYLDIVVAIALVVFLSTIAFVQFIEWQLSKDEHE